VTDWLRLAFGTLTAVRVPPPSSLAAPVPSRAMAVAPLTGLVPGLAAAVLGWLGLRLGWSALVVAALVIGVFALSTRGLHLDGLADTADGLAASYDRDRALQVMRRGDTGPTGLAAVLLVLLLQFAALSQVLAEALAQVPDNALGQLRAVAVIVVVAVVARLTIPVLCAEGVPAARAEGLGATVAGSVVPALIGLAVLAVAVLAALGGMIAGFAWWAGPLAVLATLVVAAVVTQRAVTRFGGITGDVVGAAVELGAAAVLLTLAAT
jgi:adenosylcobinamide-GDP ribazoletransferase